MIVQVQALDGTWENVGIDREHGIVPETIQLVSDGGSPTQASFSIRRDPTRYYPDLQSLAPIRFRELGEDQWTGFIKETPSDGEQVAVQCVGAGLYGDLDPYEFTPVITDLSRWKDNRSLLTENLSLYTTFGTVSSDGGIYLGFPGGGQAGVGGTPRWCGVCLDMGEQLAAGVSLDLSTLQGAGGNNGTIVYFYVRPLNVPSGVGASPDDLGPTLSTLYSLGTVPIVRRFSGRYRYIHLFIYYNGGTWTSDSNDVGVIIRRAEVYTDPLFESGGYSALTADKVVADAVARVPKWRSMTWAPAKFADLILAHPTLHRYHRFNEPGSSTLLTDNFSSGLGRWTLRGTSAASTTGGVFTPTTNQTGNGDGFQMFATGISSTALRFTRKYIFGASTAADEALILKFIPSTGYVMIERSSTQLSIYIFDAIGGTGFRQMAFVNIGLAANTTYWMRGTIQGDRVIGEWFTADPAGGATPTATVIYDLANNGELQQYGSAVSGQPGIRSNSSWVPGDDFLIEDLSAAQTVIDYSPLGWNAMAQGGVGANQPALMTADTDDPGNTAAFVQGTRGQRVRYPYGTAHGWNLSKSFTIEAVISLDALPAAGRYFVVASYMGGAVTDFSMLLWVDPGGSLNVDWYGRGALSTAAGKIVVGRKQHVMLTFELAEMLAGTTNTRLYVDGQYLAGSVTSRALPDLTNYPHFCHIGTIQDWSVLTSQAALAQDADGRIDEFAVYTGCLRDHDAQRHYEAAITRPTGESKRTAAILPSYATIGDRSANEHVAAGNALNGYQWKVGPDLLPIFRPLPAAPTLEVGDWDGTKFADASQTGIEVVNKVRGNATDALGNQLRSTRYAAGIGVPYTATIAQPANPSASVDVSSWSADHPGIDTDWARAFSPAVTPASSYAPDTGATLTRDTSAGNILTAPASFLITSGAGTADCAGSFKITTAQRFVPGRRYRVDLLLKPRSLTSLVYLGARVVVAGRQVAAYLQWNVALPTLQTTLVGLEFIATDPGTSYTVQVGWVRAAALASTALFDFDAVTAYESTDDSIPGRRGLTVAKTLLVNNNTTQAVLDKMCDLYLATHQQVPFKGSLTAQPGGVRELGADLDPIVLLRRGGELLRFGHLTDPQSLAQGRNGRMTTVTYDHASRQATVAIDSTRDDFGTLLGRLGVQSS